MATKVIAGKTVQVNDEGFHDQPGGVDEGNGAGNRQGRGHRRTDAPIIGRSSTTAARRPRVSAASRPRCGRSPPAPASRPKTCSHCSRRARPRRSRTSQGWGNRKGVFELKGTSWTRKSGTRN